MTTPTVPKVLVIGYGTVGKHVSELIGATGYNAHAQDLSYMSEPAECFDTVHITYPMLEYTPAEYVRTVIDYLEYYNPRLAIIHSTVVPEVMDLLKAYDKNETILFYSPIRATERLMKQHLKEHYCYVAVINRDFQTYNFTEIKKYLTPIFPKGIATFMDPRGLVLGKLFEVAQFGINIVLVQYLARVCVKHGWDFGDAYDVYQGDAKWCLDYTAPPEANMPWIPRPIFKPNVIGGKCVIQDIDLLERYVGGFGGIWDWAMTGNHFHEHWITKKMSEIE